MCEEHGYQRSGKKCREKFENLYKYYKKTKEGKAGRQDGKHYRFFRQLEALYGEPSNNNINIAASSSLLPPDQSLFLGNNNNNNNDNIFRFQPQPSHHQDTSVSNSSTFEDSSSSDDNGPCAVAPMDDDVHETRRTKKKLGWKVKIKDFIDMQMRKMMEKQDEWLHKLMCTMEQKERERMLREEEWRKQEACRAEKEQQFWAKERAWIESRDKALMDALQKLTGSSSTTSHEVKTDSLTQEHVQHDTRWPECEIGRLVQLRESMETRFSANQRVGSLGCLDETLWEEIALKMSCLGYERTRMACKEKWQSLSYGRKWKEDNSRSSASCYFVGNNNESNSSMYNNQGGDFATCDTNNHEGVEEGSPDRAGRNVGNAAAVNETCFPFLMGEGDHNMWANYGLKLSKGS